jgi:ribonuclease P protein component
MSVDMEHEVASPAPTSASEKAFCKDARLRSQAQLNLVRRQGRKIVGRYCLNQVAWTNDSRSKVGIVNSRSFSRKAVVRNRARRLFREAYRLLLPELSPAWILIVPRKSVMPVKMPLVYAELRSLCEKAGVLVPLEGRNGCENGI